MNEPLTRAVIREQQWVARYVAGKLSDAAAEAFEDFCIAHPDVAAEVALEKKMKAGLAVVAAESRTKSHAHPFPKPWVWAAAAAIVLLIGGALVVRDYSGDAVVGILAAVDSVGGQPTQEHVRLAELRGATIPSLGASSNSLMEVELVGQYDVDALYRVSLSATDASDDTRVIATLEASHPVSETSLKILLDGARIPAGTYSLIAAPVAPGRTLEFAFRKD